MPRYELNENPYSDKELAFIAENADKGKDWIANQLNRSAQSIVNRAWRSQISLKIPNKRNGRNIGGWLKNRKCIYPKKPSYKWARKFVFERDNWICVYCGDKAEEIDHIVPRQLGGNNMPSNLVACCKRCNYIKGTNCAGCPQWRLKRLAV